MLQFSENKSSAYIFLHTSELNNTFVNCPLGYETIHRNLACLSQAMSPVHCLSIVGRIPVVVIEDDGVSSR
jgi:hypothetical protein